MRFGSKEEKIEVNGEWFWSHFLTAFHWENHSFRTISISGQAPSRTVQWPKLGRRVAGEGRIQNEKCWRSLGWVLAVGSTSLPVFFSCFTGQKPGNYLSPLLCQGCSAYILNSINEMNSLVLGKWTGGRSHSVPFSGGHGCGLARQELHSSFSSDVLPALGLQRTVYETCGSCLQVLVLGQHQPFPI